MKGSMKQIAWAEDIKTVAMNTIQASEKNAQIFLGAAFIEWCQYTGKDYITLAQEALDRMDDARWLIDHRSDSAIYAEIRKAAGYTEEIADAWEWSDERFAFHKAQREAAKAAESKTEEAKTEEAKTEEVKEDAEVKTEETKTEAAETVDFLGRIDGIEEGRDVVWTYEGKTGTASLLLTAEEITAIYDEGSTLTQIEKAAIDCSGRGLSDERITRSYRRSFKPLALAMIIRATHVINQAGGWRLCAEWGLGGEDAE